MHQRIKEQIAQIHRVCAVENEKNLEEWMKVNERYTRAYGWHIANFPPELRHASLTGEAIRVDRFAGIYYLMSTWYESLTGRKAPCNFCVYRGWKAWVRQSCICQGFTGDETKKIISAIGTGTQYKREKRDPETVVRLLL